MSNCVVIKPLPPGATIVKVREVFSPFITEKIIVKGGKAYVKFADAGDINSLFMKYDEGFIPELGNAQIVGAPEDFSWALIDEETKQKQLKTEDFILPQSKPEQKNYNSQPKFIVVAGCDSKLLDSLTPQYIGKRIFGKYKIGRVIRYKRDLYIEFLDQNQIEMLQISFPGLVVKELGGLAGPTDSNFHYELVKSQVEKYEKEKQQLKEKEQADRIAKMRQAQREKRASQERGTGSGGFSSWNVRPSGERELLNLNEAKKPQLYWALVVAFWGIYVMFM